MKPREAWDRLAIASLFHGHSSPWALQPSDLEPRLRPCSPLAWRQADLFVFPQTGPASFALTGHETRLRGIIEDIAKSIEPRPEGPVALLIRPDDASAREPGSPEQVPALTMQARFGEAAEALRVDRRSWHRVANALDRRPDAPAASHGTPRPPRMSSTTTGQARRPPGSPGCCTGTGRSATLSTSAAPRPPRS